MIAGEDEEKSGLEYISGTFAAAAYSWRDKNVDVFWSKQHWSRSHGVVIRAQICDQTGSRHSLSCSCMDGEEREINAAAREMDE